MYVKSLQKKVLFSVGYLAEKIDIYNHKCSILSRIYKTLSGEWTCLKKQLFSDLENIETLAP